jgi:hypothetical protein
LNRQAAPATLEDADGIPVQDLTWVNAFDHRCSAIETIVIADVELRALVSEANLNLSPFKLSGCEPLGDQSGEYSFPR